MELYLELLDSTSREALSQACAQAETSEAIQPDDTPSVTEAAIDLKDLDTSTVPINTHKPSNMGVSNLVSSYSIAKSPAASAPPSLSSVSHISSESTASHVSATSKTVMEAWLFSNTAIAASEADTADVDDLLLTHTSQGDDSLTRLFPTPPVGERQQTASVSDRKVSRCYSLMQQWEIIITNWKAHNKTLQPNDYRAIKELGREGIPDCYRQDVWPRLLNAQNLYQQNEKYTDRSTFGAYLQREICSEVVTQIGKDIDRTLPKHVYFRSLEGRQALFLVLKAFASHDEDITYCQGMNCPAAILLIYIRDIPLAFWCFYRFIKRFGNMYLPSLYGLKLRALTLMHLLREIEPKIASYLQEVGIDLLCITPGWFMTVFSNCLKFSVSLRIFDSLLCEGEKAIFRAAVAIFKTAASGRMLPRPPNHLHNEFLATYGMKWPYPLDSQAYARYFDGWIANISKPGEVSLLCMPLTYAQLYLNRLPRYMPDGQKFMEQCLAVKFKTRLLNECRARAAAELATSEQM
ncbi:Rab-GTPase-TBC domain-containing protein [Giardia duodenalis]|uniref:Rab-GTPase-TBC domain-containing protein n=1 Tax=Giardia intestinalis (strain ATCC 50803 / WB clone C6) TaxID=184922 RepID=A8BIE5_GIAIC|nr:Rab-GTPase-TBC domain-containing protein [Giardia intestinalis]KAE8305652.1 Rab-GTPase-TBC domain-containing protein [Giardia intestinalis]|eukprot:XP_001706826.1 Plant adhesion molecule 1 [Giardia lamblia ATCC 50803]